MIYFEPGPSHLYHTVADHIRNALREDIPSISHRSPTFENIHQHTTNQLRKLLDIPPTHHIFFAGSSTEIWERIIQNLVEKESLHLINGAFSRKCYHVAQALNKRAEKWEVPDGHGFDNVPITKTELITVAHNETSTGVELPQSFIESLKDNNPDTLLALDVVSSIPYVKIDYKRVDVTYFSVQKGLGLPSGLAVWIVNDACIEKAKSIQKKKLSIGSHHALPLLLKFASKNQTPYTPNVLAIYLLGKLAEDMNRKGIDAIRRETEYKAALLYHTLDHHPTLKPFVRENIFRSKTVIVGRDAQNASTIRQYLSTKDMIVGHGYGQYKEEHLRFANFPVHSKEQYEMLVDHLNAP